MNNFKLLRAADLEIEFLGGQDQLFIAVVWEDSVASVFWGFSEEREPAWSHAEISPELFTRLPEASRKALGAVVADWDKAYELDDWTFSLFAMMFAELEQTPEGSPLDRALDPIAHIAAEHFPGIAAELKARTEAAELDAITAHTQPATARKSGRL